MASRALWTELMFWQKADELGFITNDEVFRKQIVDLKRKIRRIDREAENRKDPYSHIVKSDFDGYWEKIVFPVEEDDTLEDAEAFFANYYEMPYRPTYYDCTGQLFTAYHSTFKVGDKWIIYHRVDMDI